MTQTRKAACVVALVLAGVLSSILCLWGLMAMIWGGFGRANDSASILCFCLPFLLGLPLFLLSLGGTRLASLFIWVLVPFHLFWLIEVSSPLPNHTPAKLLKLLVLCLFERTELVLVFLALLVQFGIQVIPRFRIDEHFYERMQRNNDSRT
jgi:hypothetical protein